MTPRSWGRRLLLTQLAVLLLMAATALVSALLVGPGKFTEHMREAGHAQPDVLEHARQAYWDAGALALGVGLGVSLVVGVLATWVLNRSLAHGLDALAEGAERVSRGEYDHPVALTHASDELDQLAHLFNHMAQQIADAEQTRRRVLTDLGHELRTPLAATQVTLEGLQDGVVDYTPETLDTLVRQNVRLTNLARDISDVARAEEGRLPLSPRRASVDDVVAGSVRGLRDACESAGVTLEAHLESDADADLDPDRISQVVDILVSNALQHSVAGDVITVSTRASGNHATIEVRDTGTGINPDALPHVFERFFRGAPSRTREVDGGTGVGLAIARAIVRTHDGEIDAASAGAGQGSTFTVRLPRAQA